MKSPNPERKILIIGAGALGLFFGDRIKSGGSKVHFLVRPGREMHSYNLAHYKKRNLAERTCFIPDGVLSKLPDVAFTQWDAVWLCVQSTALQREWLQNLHENLPDVPIITIAQDVGSLELLRDVWGEARLVEVTPNVFAFQQHLAPSEEPSLSYWVAGGSFVITGAPDSTALVADTLERGGLKVRRSTLRGHGEVSAALVMPYMAMLEIQGWSLGRLRDTLGLPALAAREAVNAVAARGGIKAPAKLTTTAGLAKTAITVINKTAPIDLESYLAIHFRKIAEQTHNMLKEWARLAKAQGLPSSALDELLLSLPPNMAGTSPVALVTGAGSGIGRETVLDLAARGYHVIATDVDLASCQDVTAQVQRLGGNAQALQLDVSSEAEWKSTRGVVEQSHGHLDLLVNNAGLIHIGDVTEVKMDDWRRLRAVNIDGMLFGSQTFATLLAKSGNGTVINLSSTNAIKASPYDSVYGATKGAVRRLTECLAADFAARGLPVRTYAILPGPIDTALLDKVADILLARLPFARVLRRPLTATLRLLLRRSVPIGRMGKAHDIATSITRLAMAGTDLPDGELVVDGGFSG